MKKTLRRLGVVSAVVLAPMAAVTVATPGISSAQCDNGSWWDPVANICRPLFPMACENGSWWDPVANVCRPPLVPPPPACDYGSYWDPVGNVCRPVLPPPPP